MILAKVWLDRESLREQLKECSSAFDRQQQQLDRNAEQLAALRKDASSKWAFLEWRDRAEKAEAENAALQKDAARYRWLRDDKRGRSLSVSSLEWTGSAELSDAAVDAAKEEGK